METFMGYRRENGEVGVRNHVFIIPTVACANGVVKMIHEAVPGTVPLYHGHGCGKLPETGLHSKLLAHFARNGNCFAAIYVGLGCEIIQTREVGAKAAQYNPHVYTTVIQEDGGSKKTAAGAIAFAKQMVALAAEEKRQPIAVSELKVGLECGGSDALSGITANPAIGVMSDWVVAQGGTSIITETTEFIGTREIFSPRGATPEVCQQLADLIDRGERYAVEVLGDEASHVISPGNMDGGMSTIQEKSCGCIRKAGSAPVVEVLEHGEFPTQKGLCVMDGPGYDVESLTGLFGGGCQISVFSSGRGNPIGHPCMPVVKVASNSKIFSDMPGDMDVNAGQIIEGASLQQVGQEIIDWVKEAAGGRLTSSEENDQGGQLCLWTFSRSF